MKKIVLYRSKTGFTKKYADWIAEVLECEAKPISKRAIEEAKSCDVIIYGSGLMGNMIMGLNKVLGLNGKLVIFATGASRASDELVDTIKNQNKLNEHPFFYMQGGLKLEEVGLVKRKMLSMVQKSFAKKPDKTEDEAYMAEAMTKSFDATNRKYIAPLIGYVKEL